MIPDTHIPLEWGVRPVLFTVAGQEISAYSFFVVIGLAAAVALYYLNIREERVGNDGLYVAAAAVFGGVLGAKIPIWIAAFPQILAGATPAVLLSGRTVVGGIIGGALAVYLTKRKLGIERRLGNYLVPSLALGILVGRVGCFFVGCCYGTASGLPWAVDFGDGVLRHPTQLYEIILLAVVFVYAQAMKERHAPGDLFKLFVIVYFAWRFGLEFIRVNPELAYGFTHYQVVALAGMLYYLVRYASGFRGRRQAWMKTILPSESTSRTGR